MFNVLVNDTYLHGNENGGELIKRENIEPRYKWNLEDIYPSADLWKNDFDWLLKSAEKIKNYEGKLGTSSDTLFEAFQLSDEVSIKFERVHLYAMLNKDLDLGNAEYQAMYDKVISLSSKLSAASSFFNPEILELPEEKLDRFLSEKDELKIYKHHLEDLFRTKEHTLPKEQEEIMALSSPVRGVPYNVFSLFENADIKFPSVKDDKGNDIQISHGRYYAALFSQDRAYRERVYKGFYEPFKDYRNTLAALFNGNIKASMFNSGIRKYNSTREAALDRNNIPVEVYDNLVKTVEENLQPLQRWAELKKRILDVDELHPYDTYVSLFPEVKKDFTYDEGMELVLESVKPMGDQYVNDIREAFGNRWIDVYETKGKRSGAYSSGTTFGVHPFVLLNWNNQLNDVFTLAHEMGHNMHSYYTGKNQPFVYAYYSIFVAEVASTTNEALLLNYLIKNALSTEEKLSLIEKYLGNITSTFYRQTRFAAFEQLTHEMTEAGEALTPDSLCKIYGEMYRKYWGAAMVMDEEEAFTWARVPHFYYDFYVYQYATGIAAAETLVHKILNEGESAVENYTNFLRSGSSDYSINLLKGAGVDMSTPQPVLATVNKMNSLLDEMEELL